MKAIRIEKYGSEMAVKEIEMPTPAADEVVVKVHAASLNPVDIEVREGKMKVFTGSKVPRGMGVDFSGVVYAKGASVNGLNVGDEVFGWVSYKMSNTFGEYCVAKADLTIRKSPKLSFEQACCIGMTGSTAYKALYEKGGLKSGMTVLVNGCVGGVGHFAVQIAKAAGAKVVGVASESNFELAKDLGVEQVFDYKTNAVFTAGLQFDIIFDTPGKMGFTDAKKLLKRGGSYVTTKPGGSQMTALITNVFSAKKNKMVITAAKRNYLEAINRLAENGDLKVVVGKSTPFDEVLQAIEYFENGGRAIGKQVISMQ